MSKKNTGQVNDEMLGKNADQVNDEMLKKVEDMEKLVEAMGKRIAELVQPAAPITYSRALQDPVSLPQWDGTPITVKNVTQAQFMHVTIKIPPNGLPYKISDRDLESYYHVIKYAIDAGDLVQVTE